MSALPPRLDSLSASLSSGPPVAILGVPFDNVTTAQAIALVESMVRSRRPHYLVTADVAFTVQAQRDAEMQRILLDAHLVLCDGKPLLWASRKLGNPLPESMAASEFFPALLDAAEEKGWRIFLLSAEDDRSGAVESALRAKHPGLQIAGFRGGPSALSGGDTESMIRLIRESAVDLLIVLAGSPDQERWISRNYRQLGVPMCAGAGTAFGKLAGRKSERALPLGVSMAFGRAIFRQLWQLRRRKTIAGAATPPPSVPRDMTEPARLTLPARVDAAEVQKQDYAWRATATSAHGGLMVNASGVTFIDSTGMGLLIRLQKTCRNAGMPFVLVAPSAIVVRALDLMRLSRIFETVRDETEGRTQLARHRRTAVLRQTGADAAGFLSWQGELTAANAAVLWDLASAAIVSTAPEGSQAIDLGAVRFIDTTGAGLLVRLKKLAHQSSVKLTFKHPTEPVLSVLRLLKLDPYLFAS